MEDISIDFAYTPSRRLLKLSQRKKYARARTHANNKTKKHTHASYPVRLTASEMRTLEFLKTNIMPPPPLRMIRVFTAAAHDMPFWIRVKLGCDRTLSHWVTLITNMKRNKPAYISDNPNNPFLHKYEAACIMERELYYCLRLRWILRKYIARVRARIMDKRVVGTEDLYTLMPIPEEAQVQVYDLKSRTKYLFHALTIGRTLLSALQYSNYGIAIPKMPTNPYTNLAWNTSQLCSIVQQLGIYLLRRHRLLPRYISKFREAAYDITEFALRNASDLSVDAAVAFFETPTDPEPMELYREILSDLYDTGDGAHRVGWRIIRRCVLDRLLPDTLLRRWDALILSQWIWDNYHRLHGWMSLEDFNEEQRNLHILTIRWSRRNTHTDQRSLSPVYT